MDQLAEPKIAAKFIGCSPNRVRQMERNGDLPAIRTMGGQRLFELSSVMRVREQRLNRLEIKRRRK